MACESPMNIQVKMLSNPSCPSPKRCASNTSSRKGCGNRAPSIKCSTSSIKSMCVPDCMKPVVWPKPPKQPGCCNEPRPDCSRIPCCPPPLPKCPLGIYVEKVKPIRPDHHYEPPTFPFECMSLYREQYHLKCGEKAQSYKPFSTFVPSDAKLDGLSTYRETYVPKPSCPYQKPPWAIKARFDPSTAKFDGLSTYRFDYTGCMGEKVQSYKPFGQFDPSEAKMDGITTYRNNYVPYCTREYEWAKQPYAKRNLNPSFSCAPMDGLSTYRNDFWPKCCAKRKSMKPSNKARFSDAKMAECTTYRNDFNPFTFEKCIGPCVPAQMYEQVYPDCALQACGVCKDPPENNDDTEDCVRPSPCCPRQPAACGDEMGLYPGQPLPECCQPDPPRDDDDGDC